MQEEKTTTTTTTTTTTVAQHQKLENSVLSKSLTESSVGADVNSVTIPDKIKGLSIPDLRGRRQRQAYVSGREDPPFKVETIFHRSFSQPRRSGFQLPSQSFSSSARLSLSNEEVERRGAGQSSPAVKRLRHGSENLNDSSELSSDAWLSEDDALDPPLGASTEKRLPIQVKSVKRNQPKSSSESVSCPEEDLVKLESKPQTWYFIPKKKNTYIVSNLESKVTLPDPNQTDPETDADHPIYQEHSSETLSYSKYYNELSGTESEVSHYTSPEASFVGYLEPTEDLFGGKVEVTQHPKTGRKGEALEFHSVTSWNQNQTARTTTDIQEKYDSETVLLGNILEIDVPYDDSKRSQSPNASTMNNTDLTSTYDYSSDSSDTIIAETVVNNHLIHNKQSSTSTAMETSSSVCQSGSTLEIKIPVATTSQIPPPSPIRQLQESGLLMMNNGAFMVDHQNHSSDDCANEVNEIIMNRKNIQQESKTTTTTKKEESLLESLTVTAKHENTLSTMSQYDVDQRWLSKWRHEANAFMIVQELRRIQEQFILFLLHLGRDVSPSSLRRIPLFCEPGPDDIRKMEEQNGLFQQFKKYVTEKAAVAPLSPKRSFSRSFLTAEIVQQGQTINAVEDCKNSRLLKECDKYLMEKSSKGLSKLSPQAQSKIVNSCTSPKSPIFLSTDFNDETDPNFWVTMQGALANTEVQVVKQQQFFKKLKRDEQELKEMLEKAIHGKQKEIDIISSHKVRNPRSFSESDQNYVNEHFSQHSFSTNNNSDSIMTAIIQKAKQTEISSSTEKASGQQLEEGFTSQESLKSNSFLAPTPTRVSVQIPNKIEEGIQSYVIPPKPAENKSQIQQRNYSFRAKAGKSDQPAAEPMVIDSLSMTRNNSSVEYSQSLSRTTARNDKANQESVALSSTKTGIIQSDDPNVIITNGAIYMLVPDKVDDKTVSETAVSLTESSSDNKINKEEKLEKNTEKKEAFKVETTTSEHVTTMQAINSTTSEHVSTMQATNSTKVKDFADEILKEAKVKDFADEILKEESPEEKEKRKISLLISTPFYSMGSKKETQGKFKIEKKENSQSLGVFTVDDKKEKKKITETKEEKNISEIKEEKNMIEIIEEKNITETNCSLISMEKKERNMEAEKDDLKKILTSPEMMTSKSTTTLTAKPVAPKPRTAASSKSDTVMTAQKEVYTMLMTKAEKQLLKQTEDFQQLHKDEDDIQEKIKGLIQNKEEMITEEVKIQEQLHEIEKETEMKAKAEEDLELESQSQSQSLEVESQSQDNRKTYCFASALYTFKPQNPTEIFFPKGGTLNIHKIIDENWFEGSFENHVGLIPRSYVEVNTVTPMSPTQFRNIKAQVVGKFDFTGKTKDEISFKKGDIMSITKQLDKNWYEGSRGEKKGIIPLSYVEVLRQAKPRNPALTPRVGSPSVPHLRAEAATPQLLSPRQLYQATTSPQSPISHQPLHHHHVLPPTSPHPMSPGIPLHQLSPSTKAVSQRAPTYGPPTGLANRQGPLHVPASPNPQTIPALHRRPSTSSIPSHLNPTKTIYQPKFQVRPNVSPQGRPGSAQSGVFGTPRTPPMPTQRTVQMKYQAKDLPKIHRILHDYTPTSPGELPLKAGAMIHITKLCDDGWCLGTDPVSGASGRFPRNYVFLESEIPGNFTPLDYHSYFQQISKKNED